MIELQGRNSLYCCGCPLPHSIRTAVLPIAPIQPLDKCDPACVNTYMKQAVLVMWLIYLLGMMLGSGTVATVANFAFFGTAAAHVVEFLAKKSVMEKAGGSMGQHFLQTMIYGLFHWRPLEAQQASAASEES